MAPWRERSWWGWGWSGEALDDDACRRLAETSLRPWMPIDGSVLPLPYDPVLPLPRLVPPSMMQEAFAADPMTRAAHTYGKAFRDVVRALHGHLEHPPDLVCFPRTGHDVVAALDWAEAAGAAVVPYGGGTSVVGGVEYRGDGPGSRSTSAGSTGSARSTRSTGPSGSRPGSSARPWNRPSGRTA